MDNLITMNELKARVNQFIQDREWKKYHTPKDLAISIVLESSELLEIFQWLKEDEVEELIKNPEKIKKIESELADIMVYCLSLSNRLGTDLSETIIEKIRENEKKYPVEKVKGKYRKYTQIGKSS
jgi:NTP pyrophosphatase (non-canonical NTP hydrolase)